MLDIINFIFLIVVLIIIVLAIYFIKQQIDLYNAEILKIKNDIYYLAGEKYQNQQIEEKIKEIKNLDINDLKCNIKSNQKEENTDKDEKQNQKTEEIKEMEKQDEKTKETEIKEEVNDNQEELKTESINESEMNIKKILTDNMTIDPGYEKEIMNNSTNDNNYESFLNFINANLSDDDKNDSVNEDHIIDYEPPEEKDNILTSEDHVIDSLSCDISIDFFNNENIKESGYNKSSEESENLTNSFDDFSDFAEKERKKKEEKYKDIINNEDLKQIKMADLREMVKFFNITLDKIIIKYKKEELYNLIKNKIQK